MLNRLLLFAAVAFFTATANTHAPAVWRGPPQMLVALFRVGVRESAQSWRELLVEAKSRGLTIAPELAVGDGGLGLWKALDEVFPATQHQRCWVHKTANVLNKVAVSVQANMKCKNWYSISRTVSDNGASRQHG